MKRKLFSLILIICLTVSTWSVPAVVHGSSSVSWKQAMESTEQYLVESVEAPEYGNEWILTGLARAGGGVKYGTYDAYYKNLTAVVKDCKGVLDTRKALPYAKVVMALTAMGKDPQNVAGYNLLEGFSTMEKIMLTGTNGPIWALLALDSGNYDIPAAPEDKTQTTRELLVETVLSRELPDGGFTVGMSTDGPETDITAMAVQALAPYRDREDVQAVIDRSLDVLSNKQAADGCFEDYNTKSSESIAQVILALTAQDIHPAEDARFVKNGHTLIDALTKFYVSGGGFRHIMKTGSGHDAPVNGIATEQAYLALTAYERYLQNQNHVFHMTDGVPMAKPEKVSFTSLTKGLGQMTLKWKKVTGVSGYEIQYADNKSFTSAKSIIVKGSATVSKTVTGLSHSKTRYFRIRAYKMNEEGEKRYGVYSGYRYGIPDGKASLKSLTTGLKQATVKWNPVAGAKGYQIRYASNKSFSNYRTINVSASTLSRTITGLSTGKYYYFKVRAYRYGSGNSKLYGAFSSYKYAKPDGKVKSVTLKSPKKRNLKVSWNQVAGAKGYQIRYATNKSFKNSKSIYVSSKYSAKTFTKMTSKKGYYVKVRAYTKSSSGKKIFGAYSTTKYLKVK